MPGASQSVRADPVPLAVDMDGTLLRTDLIWEYLLRFLRQRPLAALALAGWWLRGRAFLKQQLAARVQVDPTTLPYSEEFLDWLREQKRAGRRLVLATASDVRMAEPVARHVGLFDELLASDGRTNLRDRAKRDALARRFGERGFDYAGNSPVDLDVWAGARRAIVVNANARLAARAAQCAELGPVFERSGSRAGALLRLLRPHQWLKNLIVFVPLVTAHQLTFWPLLAASGAFVALCLCAAGGYVLNDLFDLDADRRHPLKRRRPFAAGDLPLALGPGLAAALLVAGLVLGWMLAPAFAGLLLGYVIVATAYSLWWKRLALLDVFVLAGLYTLRLAAGHVVTGIAWSAWLLVFAMFIFLSLALLKRFPELQELRRQNQARAEGRGYAVGDIELVTTLGLMCGALAVLVMALYVNSEQVTRLYRHPTLLLAGCPLLLFWISRLWLLAHRGRMAADPVLFVLKDPISYAIGALMLLIMWLAS
ncbi:MAG: UbiA family prenyltransferase [Verrucomicrobiae bacterium]|nr:UbiA family prenyltransferase [Verrucomicrobiae bacterium]